MSYEFLVLFQEELINLFWVFPISLHNDTFFKLARTKINSKSKQIRIFKILSARYTKKCYLDVGYHLVMFI